MVEAMLRGWRAQQTARGLRVDTIDYRERLVRRFVLFTNEFPWQWGPGQVDEWTLTLTSENHLTMATIRGYQTDLRLFSEYLTDTRYGWGPACEEAFGEFPVPICHEWNTIAHLNDYEGSPEARPLSREELQRFLDYADEQVERAARSHRKGALAACATSSANTGWASSPSGASSSHWVDSGSGTPRLCCSRASR